MIFNNFLLITLILLGLPMIYAECSGYGVCFGHGICVNNTCVCDSGWNSYSDVLGSPAGECMTYQLGITILLSVAFIVHVSIVIRSSRRLFLLLRYVGKRRLSATKLSTMSSARVKSITSPSVGGRSTSQQNNNPDLSKTEDCIKSPSGNNADNTSLVNPVESEISTVSKYARLILTDPLIRETFLIFLSMSWYSLWCLVRLVRSDWYISYDILPTLFASFAIYFYWSAVLLHVYTLCATASKVLESLNLSDVVKIIGLVLSLIYLSSMCTTAFLFVPLSYPDYQLVMLQLHYSLKGITLLIMFCVGLYAASKIVKLLDAALLSSKELVKNSNADQTELLRNNLVKHINGSTMAAITQIPMNFVMSFVPFFQPLSSYFIPLQNILATYTLWNILNASQGKIDIIENRRNESAVIVPVDPDNSAEASDVA